MDPRSSAAGEALPRDVARASAPRGATRLASKVPEVTIYFWITKVLTTGMGETTSDFLVHRLGPPTAVAVSGVGLVGALALQFRACRYSAPVYWFAVVTVSIAGTVAADVLHVQFGVPYLASTIFLIVVLAAVFLAWFRTERTLSMHSIFTVRRECFYWAAILTTFALGTAAGDMTATTMNLGFFTSGIVFAVLIAIPTFAWWRFRMNPIVAFWFAYIVTRPLGASFSDWMAVPHARSGLGWGDGPVSFVLLVAIVALVGYLTVARPDIDETTADA
jgi:uncharacterized membrane-anchored protein